MILQKIEHIADKNHKPILNAFL